MLRWFVCPDNGRIEVKDCLKEGGCRMAGRCASRSYLRMAASDRPWKGKPSTTQLIDGVMSAFLKITKDYATSPDNRAWMINGTRGHSVLEGYSDEYSELEVRLTEGDVSGIADCIETENGKRTLSDSKISGSYKVAKALGFKTVEEETEEVFKSGKKKGLPKMRKILIRKKEYEDRKSWSLQLNKYRILWEKQTGEKIDKLKIQCIVRDGGLWIAHSRGLFRNVYYFDIDIEPDEEIEAYFEKKKEALFKALKQGYWDTVCDREENWDGLKCQRYCDVAMDCPLGKYLKQERETDEMAIKGLSQARRMPRLGKIRLGIKKKTKTGKEYPAEVDYFILDPVVQNEDERQKMIDEFHALYGDQPKSIEIMFPVGDPAIYFPQDLKRYGSGSSLKCKGDGETATCASEEFAKDLKIIGKSDMGTPIVECKHEECPYYKSRQCSETGVLNVLLPKLPGAGVWQIVTGSKNSIININSGIDSVTALCGRAHMIPLKLERVPTETIHEGKKSKHYILQINMNFRLSDLQKQAMIDPTKIAMELPPPEAEKEDLLFQENQIVNTETGEVIEETVVETVPVIEDDVIPEEVVEPPKKPSVSTFEPTQEELEIQADLDPSNPKAYNIYAMSLHECKEKTQLSTWNTAVIQAFKDKQITKIEKENLLCQRDSLIQDRGWK